MGDGGGFSGRGGGASVTASAGRSGEVCACASIDNLMDGVVTVVEVVVGWNTRMIMLWRTWRCSSTS